MAVFTQTTTIANGATADGGQVNTEIVNLGNSVNNIVNDQISASAAIAISKTELGAYTAPTVYSSTITGFSGTPTQSVVYTRIGKKVSVNAIITGTSNATGFTFTVPSTSVYQVDVVCRVFDSGAYATGMIELGAGSSTVNVYRDTQASAFSNSGTKTVQVQFWYLVA